ncbi:proline dehydrogenase family protein [Granulicella sp. WH15]|uniref:proline dehydrogenase family protein n=1 Tax=Granulicella sp. WH15 TaxID=2602070 RepID=UPI0021053C30|nr:proline dehydrogenase family protein [Granulicella sp. WH15]
MSRNRIARTWAERSSVGRRLSSRFVAGMTVEAALRAAEAVNREGIAVSLDSLGEGVTDAGQAHRSASVYHRLIDEIGQRGLNANVSVKLSQMGMEFDPELAEAIVAGIVAHADEAGNFVRLDMEGSAYTEATVGMTERLHGRWPGRVGTVLQAYLHRTADDAARLVGQGIRIRLCKGAYQEPAAIAFAEKADVDENYTRLMFYLATSGVFCGMATHDEAIIQSMCAFIEENELPKSLFEFQMLYGVRRDLQRRLASQGYGVRVYIPFGAEWYPYFMRRLAERPANVLFLAKNLLRS